MARIVNWNNFLLAYPFKKNKLSNLLFESSKMNKLIGKCRALESRIAFDKIESDSNTERKENSPRVYID